MIGRRNILGPELIECKSQPIPECGCWVWMQQLFPNRYGVLWLGNKRRLAHRESYRAYHGGIPDGMLVLHRCDMPECVNPAHLFLGTNLDNSIDKGRKGRNNHLRGVDTSWSKLTDEQVRSIRSDERYNYLVAADYGIDTSSVCRIKNHQQWKHVK